jgi:hypothetical protein
MKTEVRDYILTMAEEQGINNPEKSVDINDKLIAKIEKMMDEYKTDLFNIHFLFRWIKKLQIYKVVPIISYKVVLKRNSHKIKKIDIKIDKKEEALTVVLVRKDNASFKGIYFMEEYYSEKNTTWTQMRWKMLQKVAVTDMITMYVDDVEIEIAMVNDEIENETITTEKIIQENNQENNNENENENINIEHKNIEYKDNLAELRDKALYKLEELVGTPEETANFIESCKINMNDLKTLKFILNEKNNGYLIDKVKAYFKAKVA